MRRAIRTSRSKGDAIAEEMDLPLERSWSEQVQRQELFADEWTCLKSFSEEVLVPVAL